MITLPRTPPQGSERREPADRQATRSRRRFARRQDSWFRKDPRITWVAHDDPDRVRRALAAIGQAATTQA